MKKEGFRPPDPGRGRPEPHPDPNRRAALHNQQSDNLLRTELRPVFRAC